MSAFSYAFSAFSFMSFFLVSIPLPLHFQARNTATCLYIIWISLSNLFGFIDSIIWKGNSADKAPTWCDISSRVIFASFSAVPATCLCIQFRVYRVLAYPLSNNITAHRRHAIMFDLLICLFIPILSVVLASIVQPYRYIILEDMGCRIAFIETPLAVVLVPGLRLSICIASVVYGCLNMYFIWNKRREMNSIPNSVATGHNYYIRLFALSGIDMLITLPSNSWYLSTWFPVTKYPGWTATHIDWSQILQLPVSSWRDSPTSILLFEFPRWMGVVYGLLFFAIFGVGGDASAQYESAWAFILKTFHLNKRFSHKSPKPLVQMNFARNPNPPSCSSSPADSNTLVSSGMAHESTVAISTISYEYSKPEAEPKFPPSEV